MHDDDNYDDPPAWQDSDPVDEALSPLLAEHRQKTYELMEGTLKRNAAKTQELFAETGAKLVALVESMLGQLRAEVGTIQQEIRALANTVGILAVHIESQQRRIEALERLIPSQGAGSTR